MSIDKIIYDILISDATVTGLVGSVTSGVASYKVFPSQAPQTTQFPFIVFEVVSTTPTNTKSGASEMDFYRVQVTSLSKTNPNANAIAEAVRGALDYYKDLQVQNISFQNQNSGFDNISSQDGVYLKYQDYLLTLTR